MSIIDELSTDEVVRMLEENVSILLVRLGRVQDTEKRRAALARIAAGLEKLRDDEGTDTE